LCVVVAAETISVGGHAQVQEQVLREWSKDTAMLQQFVTRN